MKWNTNRSDDLLRNIWLTSLATTYWAWALLCNYTIHPLHYIFVVGGLALLQVWSNKSNRRHMKDMTMIAESSIDLSRDLMVENVALEKRIAELENNDES